MTLEERYKKETGNNAKIAGYYTDRFVLWLKQKYENTTESYVEKEIERRRSL